MVPQGGVGACAGIALAIGGCGLFRGLGAAERAEPEALAVEPVRREVVADWNDVEAAVNAAVGRAKLAVEDHVARTASGADVRAETPVSGVAPPAVEHEFALRGLRGEEGTLHVRRLDPPEQADPVRMEIGVKVGVLGRPEAQERLLDALEWRLKQLRGRDWAEVSWPD